MIRYFNKKTSKDILKKFGKAKIITATNVFAHIENVDDLMKNFKVLYDQQGSIGKRYYRQDEAGTPFCITVDHESKENNTVTLRNRDDQNQDRVPINDLGKIIQNRMDIL